MTISQTILDKQQAYAARPFSVTWSTSHFGGTFRFDTLAEAFAYVDQQWANIRKRVASERYCSSALHQSRMAGPGFDWSLRHVLLAPEVSSY